MKQVTAFTIMLMLSVIAASAQSKINNTGRRALERYRKEALNRPASATPAAAPTTGVVVTLRDGADASALTGAGFEVAVDLGDVVTATVPIDRLEELASLPEVLTVEAGGRKRVKLANAHAATGVSALHSGIDFGTGIPSTFTGRGVVAGIMDTGIDPNHLFFRGQDGRTRIKRFWVMSNNGAFSEYTDETMTNVRTDDATMTHGTHVAGILGGQYCGTATYRTTPTEGADGAEELTGQLPYTGVAPEATLALAGGSLADNSILQGVKNILDYADGLGMPAAVNLSLGANAGPHDGTDGLTKGLSRLGERGIICVSAGNEGDLNMSISQKLTTARPQFSTVVQYVSGLDDCIDGVVDIWADDPGELTVTLSGVKKSGALTPLVSTNTYDYISFYPEDNAPIQSGSMDLLWNLDEGNNRYNVTLYCDGLVMARGYNLAITVKGKAGQTVSMYFDGYSEFNDRYITATEPLDGFVAGTPDESINTMACGDNILSIGAYTTTECIYDFGESLYTYGEKFGATASFSGYGHNAEGTPLPQVSAPGTVIMSAYSTPAINAGYESTDDMTAKATSGSTTYYWGPMQGTSMSAPYATGVCALMLQADPTLTAADVRDILMTTAANDEHTAAAPAQFGAGKIDPVAAVREVLRRSASIGAVSADGSTAQLMLRHTGPGLEASLPGQDGLTAELYSTAGALVEKAASATDTVTLDTSRLQPGVYIIRVTGSSANASHKITIR